MKARKCLNNFLYIILNLIKIERNPNPTKIIEENINGVACDHHCNNEEMTTVSTTFDTVDTLISQNDKEEMPSTSHGKLGHKKRPVEKSDKAVNTTSELQDPLLNNKNYSKSSKKYLNVDTTGTKRKFSANLSLETGTVSHRLASAVSMNRLTLDADSVTARDGNSKETQMQKIQREKAKMAQAKERKAARTMAVIVSTFIICWLPFFLMYVIVPFVSKDNAPSPRVRNRCKILIAIVPIIEA